MGRGRRKGTQRKAQHGWDVGGPPQREKCVNWKKNQEGNARGKRQGQRGLGKIKGDIVNHRRGAQAGAKRRAAGEDGAEAQQEGKKSGDLYRGGKLNVGER